MDLKSMISTPLEAGTSLLDAHRLPSYLVPALEYVSERLAAKGLHVTLVVARRDYQLPDQSIETKDSTSLDDTVAPTTNLPSPPYSPAYSPDPKQQLHRSKTWAFTRKPAFSAWFDGGLASPRLRRPHATTPTEPPKTPRSAATTITLSAAAATPTLGPHDLHSLRLIHTTTLTPRATKLVAATLARASHKFHLRTPLEVATGRPPLPPPVLHSSILQNDVLHASAGLTLLSLDHLYTFKCALTRYGAGRAEPRSQFRLEDAVDELRRYVLLSGGAGRRRLLLKSVLVAAYDWLGPVDETALEEVMRMYSRAYGGATEKGVEDDLVKESGPLLSRSAAAVPAVDDKPLLAEEVLEAKTIFAKTLSVVVEDGASDRATGEPAALAVPPVPTSPPPPIPIATPPLKKLSPRPSLPSLRLQTNFDSPKMAQPKPRRRKTPTPLTATRCQSPDIKTATTPKPQKQPQPTPLNLREDKEIQIEIKLNDFLDLDSESEAESVLTEFEDADLTARSPAGGFWLGIDELLGAGGADAVHRRPRPQQQKRNKRRSSVSLLSPATPAAEKLGPMTPHGYEDISPITRGEWGFLMVSDPFKTKTAAVSCV